ncbi:MAG: UvrB/UvrC motif-containing protein [Spirochaetes bacterium]|jgi:protein arginine kinase activator|nr:UvrB/UvrC motif-containing protein [Spirochaetota bacterium]
MICERCSKTDATVHLTEIIKGVKSEVHLCEDCAREIGLNSKLSNFSLAVPDFLSFLNDEIKEINENSRSVLCRNCGLDLSVVEKTHRVNCPYCYHFFADKINQIIGFDVVRHTGSGPENYTDFSLECDNSTDTVNYVNDVSILKSRLDLAVENEEYEEAALLRDKIKDLEQICRGN